MREILFRGKRVDNGEWIEGFYHNVYTSLSHSSDRKVTHHHIYSQDFDVIVEGDTVGQFTGLLDKNGKKIFEGDIIKHKLGKTAGGGNLYSKFCVNFSLDYGGFQAFANGLQGYCYPSLTLGKITWKPEDNEIIGNIYDNPELLEG